MELATGSRLHNEAIYCSLVAAVRYDVPMNLMLAVADAEAGSIGLWRSNTNGTSDVGQMQFNTAYLATLSKYGITLQSVAMPGCYPFYLAAWRIACHLTMDTGDVWQRAANYHSRTPRHNARYRLVLIARARLWSGWLSKCAANSCLEIDTSPHAATVTRNLAAGWSMPPIAHYIPRAISVSEPR